MSNQPAACGNVANAIADLLPKNSAVDPASKAPKGFDITPNEAIQEVSDTVAKFVSNNFGIKTALKPCDKPTDICPECAASPARICGRLNWDKPIVKNHEFPKFVIYQGLEALIYFCEILAYVDDC